MLSIYIAVGISDIADSADNKFESLISLLFSLFFFKVYIPLENNFSFATTYQMFVVFFFSFVFFFAITLLVYIAIITTLIKGDHLTREIILIPSKNVFSTS